MSEETAIRVDEEPEPTESDAAEPDAEESEPPPEALAAPEPPPEASAAPDTASEPEPEPEPATAPATAPCETPAAKPVAWWPYLVYLTLWAALVAASVYLLAGPDATGPALENPAYPNLLLATVALTAIGPLLAVFTWAFAWYASSPGCRGGLLTTALVRGASATLFGVLAWWVALVIIDALRLGML